MHKQSKLKKNKAYTKDTYKISITEPTLIVSVWDSPFGTLMHAPS